MFATSLRIVFRRSKPNFLSSVPDIDITWIVFCSFVHRYHGFLNFYYKIALNAECTGSRPITEVKQRRAGSVLVRYPVQFEGTYT